MKVAGCCVASQINCVPLSRSLSAEASGSSSQTRDSHLEEQQLAYRCPPLPPQSNEDNVSIYSNWVSAFHKTIHSEKISAKAFASFFSGGDEAHTEEDETGRRGRDREEEANCGGGSQSLRLRLGLLRAPLSSHGADGKASSSTRGRSFQAGRASARKGKEERKRPSLTGIQAGSSCLI